MPVSGRPYPLYTIYKNMGSIMNILEEGNNLTLDFSKIEKVSKSCKTLIPVAVQHHETKEVILIAYTNEEAFKKTIHTRIATFWSTSRNELWIKGKTSGNTFNVINIFVNCEQNSLVYIVKPENQGICHTVNKKGRTRNCFYRSINLETLKLENMDP
jgi:phosphoribosyl-AMP cyclohydrolase